MRKPKLRELGEAVRALVVGPYTSAFPAAESIPAPAFRGKPEYRPDTCVACGACAEVCPASAMTMEDDIEATPPVRRMTLRLDRCIFCGHCELNCLCGDGIHLTPQYDTATLDRHAARESIEKDLVLCEACGGPIATRAHLAFLVRELGGGVHANPTLLIAQAEALGLVNYEPPDPLAHSDRAHLGKALCPKCRRSGVARETWG